MADERLRIFLSYRQEDCALHAKNLAEDLRELLNADVFRDIDNIPLGVPFPKYIDQEINKCDAVIVMIGDDWLSMTDQEGKPRLEDPLDWVHIEIISALQREVPVIPVLVEGSKMPRPEELPEPIRDLAYRNGAEIRANTWREDVERLATAIPTPEWKRVEAQQATPKQAKKERASIDFIAAREFIESVPPGRWTTHKDVSLAGGSPTGAMAVGTRR